MEPRRADPDALLSHVQSEERAARRGKLKIFFGATAGVGKTYAMLEAAQRRKAEGIDVVVGYVEPHGRTETERLLEGLESLPFRLVPEGGALVREFDLDRALQRRPQLLLVDELAHTNAEGSRHAKRWQDIDELRAAGIDVWTTVNVQHLESLNDVVAGITTVRMQETVPDTVFEAADEVELIDLPPDDLLQRLREGKVYVPERVRVALDNFFRKGNLIALREMALRKTAERVDAMMDRYRATEGIGAPWAAGERILVGVGPGSDGETLVRAGKRLAAALRAEWIVVYVETPDLIRLPEAERNRRIAYLRLAEMLGAEAVTLGGHSAAEELVHYARTRNVSRVLLGEPSRTGFRRWIRPSTVDQVLARIRGIDVTVVKATEAMRMARSPLLARSAAYLDAPASTKRRWPPYLWAAVGVAAATAVAWFTTSVFNEPNVVMIYLLSITLIAWRLGRGPAVAASVASTLAYNFFFVPPIFTLNIADGQYLITFAVLTAVGVLISTLMNSVRLQARVAGYRERRTALLYAMSRELAAARGAAAMASVAVRHIGEAFEAQAAVLMPGGDGVLEHPRSPPEAASLRGADLSVAQWVNDHAQKAGLGTDTLPAAPARYLPLVGSHAAKSLGVLAVLPANPRRILLPEQAHLLETFASQLALALERADLAERAQAATVAAETESVRNSLLAAISHDMRTPLAVIGGAASSLAQRPSRLPEEARQELAQTIVDESRQLTQLVANVLDMTRFESGQAIIRPEWVSLEEVVGGALQRLQPLLAGHRVETRLDEAPPLVFADPVLLEQLLYNLLENAAKYTPAGSHVVITVQRHDEGVEILIADDGPGFPADVEPEMLFGKFQRGRAEGAIGGVGLGLAICRAIARAHGGEIHAERIPAGGALFVVSLPQLKQAPEVPPEEAAP
ncbi:MAG TPA: sensor histidine kinase KdpD [Burkholderiaceae bacterium]|nr:sensor histidine kinase KdpD [Burkholderiaceae bacterium]HQR70951.1 sensor histidine kinase KdpD [Burkholderiaceae bacterium]